MIPAVLKVKAWAPGVAAAIGPGDTGVNDREIGSMDRVAMLMVLNYGVCQVSLLACTQAEVRILGIYQVSAYTSILSLLPFFSSPPHTHTSPSL